MTRLLLPLFIVILIVTMAPNQTRAFFAPGNPPSDDNNFNNFGPMTQNLLITPYAGQQNEYLAFKAGDIDFMDWPLTSSQVDELNTIDPNMDTYARAFIVDLGMRQFDLNNMRFPTDDVNFRKALSYCVDKNNITAVQLRGLALKMDSPLAGNTAWYNPYCTDLYPYSLGTAAALLAAYGYVDSNSDGWREGPLGQTINLEFYSREDDPNRAAMGVQMVTALKSIGIKVSHHIVSRSTCFDRCMRSPYNYHVYTGGWSFGRDPTVLPSLYHSQYAQAYNNTGNYPGYRSAEFDAQANAMLTATQAGNSSNPGDAKYHVYEMQRVLMDDAGVIPVFTVASYGAYKTGWNNVVNAEQTRPWSWYTMLNAHQEGKDTIRWGFMYDILEQLNPIHASWFSDWQLIGQIYDTLINVDPYDTSRDLPSIAKGWTMGTWTYNSQQCATIEFKLREDMYWHDVPPKADRETPNGVPFLTTGANSEKVMADDVVFSLRSVKALTTAWNHMAVEDMVFAEEKDPFTVKVYMNSSQPLWSLHSIGYLPVIPRHVWEPIFLEGTTETFDAVAQKCLVGSGPWVYDYDASSLHNYYMLRAFTRHFRYHPLDVVGEPRNTYKKIKPDTTINIDFYLHWMDSQRPLLPNEVTISIWATVPVDTDVWLPDGGSMIVTAGSPMKVYETSNPQLEFCQLTFAFNLTAHVDRGLYIFEARITPDPLTGHTDAGNYPVYVWGTIAGDIDLDFYVNGKDAAILGRLFGSLRGGFGWKSECDLNGDGYINAKDAVKLAVVFGWPG